MPSAKVFALATIDKTSLGNMLLEDGVLTHDELLDLLAEFQDLKVEELLGQFLVRRGVITPEKLQFLLIRQAASRNGGVEKVHLRQAIEIAQRTSENLSDTVDDFSSGMHAALAKVSEAK